MIRETVALVHVDALRHDFVTPENMPFLSELAREGVSGSLVPTFGFEPDAAYLSGLYPEDYDGGMHFCWSPETSPFTHARYIPAVADRLWDWAKFPLRMAVRALAQFRSPYRRLRLNASPARIPFRFLKHFDIALKYLPFEPSFTPSPSVFGLVSSLGKRWLFHGPPTHEVLVSSVVRGLKKQLRSHVDFSFIFVGDLDYAGHRFGPGSPEMREALRMVDQGLAEVVGLLAAHCDVLKLVVLGDHGMVDVRRCLDVQAKLADLDLEPEKDYLYFLDSTFARFWFDNRHAREVIRGLMESLDGGVVVDDALSTQYRIRFGDRRFGDLIFWVDSGTLILPNFFQGAKPVRGMHGYAADSRDNHAAFVIYDSAVGETARLEEPIDMIHVFPTVLRLLGIAPGRDVKGRDVLEMCESGHGDWRMLPREEPGDDGCRVRKREKKE